MREPYRDRTDINMSGEMSKSPSHIPITSTRGPGPTMSNPTPQHVPQVQLNSYQKKLLEQLQAKPAVMKLMSVIFQQYPSIVAQEVRQRNPNATNRQQRSSRDTTRIRLNMEAFIEEEIAKLAGIDTEQLLKEAKAETKGTSQGESWEQPQEK